MEAVDAAPEVEQLAPVGEDAELPHERDDLGKHRGDGGAANAPAEAVDEERIEHRIDNHRIDGGVHRLARVARGAQHGVQPQIHVRDDVAQQNHGHVLARIAHRRLARTEEIENRVEEEQRDDAEGHADNQIEHEDVAQHLAGRVVVALSEAHRDERRGTHAHQRAEGRREVHQREGERQTRDGERAHAVADEDAVHHVVERRGRHGNDGRHGILHEQFANTLGSELHGRSPYLRHNFFSPFFPCVVSSRCGCPQAPRCLFFHSGEEPRALFPARTVPWRSTPDGWSLRPGDPALRRAHLRPGGWMPGQGFRSATRAPSRCRPCGP